MILFEYLSLFNSFLYICVSISCVYGIHLMVLKVNTKESIVFRVGRFIKNCMLRFYNMHQLKYKLGFKFQLSFLSQTHI